MTNDEVYQSVLAYANQLMANGEDPLTVARSLVLVGASGLVAHAEEPAAIPYLEAAITDLVRALNIARKPTERPN